MIQVFKAGLGEADVVIDGVLSSVRQRSVELTQSPVESGAPLSDHVGVEPARYQFEGVLAVVPPELELESPEDSGFNDEVARLRAQLDFTRPETALSVLVSYLEIGERLLVREINGPSKSPRGSFELSPVVLTSLEDRRASPGSRELIVTGTFQQVRIAFTRERPSLRRSKRHTAPAADLGIQATPPATTEQAKRSSIAIKVYESLF